MGEIMSLRGEGVGTLQYGLADLPLIGAVDGDLALTCSNFLCGARTRYGERDREGFATNGGLRSGDGIRVGFGIASLGAF